MSIKSLFAVLATLLMTGCPLMADIAGSSEVRTLGDFNRIEVGGLTNVVLVHGAGSSAEVKAAGIELEDIITEVTDGILKVDTRGFHSGESIRIIVTYSQLESVKTAGSSTVKSDGPISADKFKVIITGNGDADLELNVASVEAYMSGGGNLRLTGKAGAQKIISRGSNGSLNNAGLESVN
ncbi:head GIN domain-containing protein [Microbulbifer sp. 2304DJ12-6]|uniref:head GIN domain-containing protein n=1 Tax=Microbulbifer sp. 2304DJ12-6 TaxID=3233340 RepID=UPI0039AF251F